MEFKDYYQTMGVSKTATDDEIKKAYRKLARKYHPDVSKEPGAEAKFKEVNEAYDVLKDPEKRKAYDQLGANWKAGQQFDPNGFDFSQFKDFQGFQGFHGGSENADFGDFFEHLFGGGRGGHRGATHRRTRAQHGEDLHVSMPVALSDAFHGVEKTVNLTVPEVSSEGYIEEVPKTLKIKIPAGILEGQQIRLTGQGAPGLNGGHPGDLYIKVHLKEDPNFRLEGKHIYSVLNLTPWQAGLGASVEASILGGNIQVKIPAGAKSGQKLRLKGKGMPHKTEAGDHFLEIMIQTPKAETEQQRQFYEEMAKVFA